MEDIRENVIIFLRIPNNYGIFTVGSCGYSEAGDFGGAW